MTLAEPDSVPPSDEFLVLDADAHNFIVGPTAGTHIHHNIFARYCTVDPNLNSSIAVIYKGDDIQIYGSSRNRVGDF